MIAGKQKQPASLAPPSPNAGQPGRTPYLPGFQPPGVYRVRTDELVKSRRMKGEVKKAASGRINRRLEKLIKLHFPSPSAANNGNMENGRMQRSSSTTSFSLKDLASPRSVSANDLWSSVRRSIAGQSYRKNELTRLQEQSIVHWQEDKEITTCPLCGISFSLTIRKHHCRLCGRVVCYVPPNSSAEPLGRQERCSTFVNYQWEDEEDGWLVEMEDSLEEDLQAVREKDGVRVCKECLDVVM